MRDFYEIALIMKKIVYENGNIEFVPLQVLEGTYDEEEGAFIDFDGTPYYHIIENPESVGFLYRDNISNHKKNYPYLTSKLIKALILKTSKKYTYTYNFCKKDDTIVPTILFMKNKENSEKLLLDRDILEYYTEVCPEFIAAILGEENELGDDIEVNDKNNLSDSVDTAIDVAKIYSELTSKVIDQDEPIRKILTAVWKQYNDFSDKKSRNILINGSTGVGKTETFRLLTKMLKVPYFMSSATEYSATGYIGKNVEDMLIGLLKNANYDLEKAQRGILIIDEIDKISQSGRSTSQINQRDVQEALLKILEDGIFNLNVNNREYTFDTSKVMVIGMGSWSRIELKETRPVGFDSKPTKKEYKDITREDIVAAGMIPELIGRFPTIVQMNELNHESFIRILHSENNLLNLNKRFLKGRGIELTVQEKALNEIADKAIKQKYGARSLDEIVETALSLASFEIASNPEKYSELIITPETIHDNKKYILIKKQEKEKM